MPYDPNDPGAEARGRNKKAEENVNRFFDGVRKSNEANERHRQAKNSGTGCLVSLAVLSAIGLLLFGLLS